MTIHLPYGGSSAHRTIGCPGWLKKSENLPKRPAGQAAIDGSMHHEVQERCQRNVVEPNTLLGLIYKEPGTDITREFTEDDLDLAEIMFNATNNLLDELDIDEFLVEPFVELVPGKAGGSIDLLGLSRDRKTLLILDYKTGSVKVLVEASPNLGLYAISARVDPTTADLFEKVKRVVFAIVQPRVKGVVFKWETTPKLLDSFEHLFRDAMVFDTISPGPHCKYCPAEPYCPEKRAAVVGANLLGARDQEELKAAAEIVNEVEDWVKSIKEEIYLQMVRGVPLQGWKIVNKTGKRILIDEKKTEKALIKAKVAKKHIFKTSMLTAPQLERVLKKLKVKFDLDKFITWTEPGTTIATEDDGREAVIVSDVQGHLKEMMK